MAKEPMSGAAGSINRAQASLNTGRQTKSAVRTGSVGSERPANPASVQLGGSAAEAGGALKGAMRELHAQHPHNYDDHGPHHGTTEHIRHKPAVRPA